MKTMLIMLSSEPWFLEDLGELFAILLICGLPIVIAVLVYLHKRNDTNKRSQVILAALEKDSATVPEELLRSLNKPQKSLKERLLGKLLWGVLCSVAGTGLLVARFVNYFTGIDSDNLSLGFGLVLLAIGVACLVYYFVGRRMLRKELEAGKEENV